jgi:uncharacterized protein YcbX
MIETWASMKSFRPKGESDGEAPPAGRNGERDFHGETRSNETHASTTDPAARLTRRGRGREAKLCYAAHVVMENRNGLAVAARVTQATGTGERDECARRPRKSAPSSEQRRTAPGPRPGRPRRGIVRRRLNAATPSSRRIRRMVDSPGRRGEGAVMSITVTGIDRYPVKGLSAEPLAATDLTVGEGVSGDRRFALALPSTWFDPDRPQWLPKTGFLMLMRNERLAALDTRYDAGEGILTIRREGKPVARGKITTPVGRAMIEEFFDAYMQGEIAGKPRLVAAPAGHMFSDHRNKVLSIINLATVRDLERVVGQPVDPRRFRANLYLEGADPWAEFDWVDRDVDVGEARLRVTARIDRCAATTVRPGVGTRDINVPKALQRGFGHVDCGVYARVTADGRVAVGDRVQPP